MSAQNVPNKCNSVYLRIAPGRINLLRFLLEGYDGLAIVSTLDSQAGLVRLLVPVSRYGELFRMLPAVAPELTFSK